VAGLLDFIGSQGGGLLDFLRQNAMNQQFGSGLPSDQAQYAPMPMQAMAQMPRQAQPSPLDTAQWPSGPVGAPSQGSAALPPNAQPTQGQLPQQPAQPQQGGFLQSLNENFQNMGNGGSLIGALTGQSPSNQTAQFLVSKGIDPAMAKTIVSDPSLMRSILPHVMGVGRSGQQPAKVQEYLFAKQENPSLTFEKFLQRERSTNEYGMTPLFAVNKETNQLEAYQLGKNGEPVKVKLPPGVEIARGIEQYKTATEVITMNKQTGEILKRESLNVAEGESQQKQGQAQGTAKAALPAAETTTTRALNMLKQLNEHPGLGDGVGFIVGRLPALTPKAADFRERVEQVDAMVFGDAVEVMRGLGALTEKEGPKVTAARARLKTAKSEEDFRTALKDIREVFETGIENMRQKAGVGGSSASAAAPKRIRLNADGTIAQ
jgi:hypothetical protein